MSRSSDKELSVGIPPPPQESLRDRMLISVKALGIKDSFIFSNIAQNVSGVR